MKDDEILKQMNNYYLENAVLKKQMEQKGKYVIQLNNDLKQFKNRAKQLIKLEDTIIALVAENKSLREVFSSFLEWPFACLILSLGSLNRRQLSPPNQSKCNNQRPFKRQGTLSASKPNTTASKTRRSERSSRDCSALSTNSSRKTGKRRIASRNYE